MDNNIIELPSPMGGVMWKGHLSGLDDTGDSLRINDGYSTVNYPSLKTGACSSRPCGQW